MHRENFVQKLAQTAATCSCAPRRRPTSVFPPKEEMCSILTSNSTWKQRGSPCLPFTRWSVLGLVLTVLGLVLSWGQLRLAHIESERARRAEPLSYSLEAVDTHYQYEIQKDGAPMSIPAPSTRLQVSHGSLHSITAICFDGTTMHELAQLPIQDSWDGCVVDVTMPPKAVIPEEGLIHDYFFLFLEPTEGEGRLDLICNTISLETQEVQSRVYHPISLIQLDYLPEGPVREMLSAYAVLQERLGDLGLISA